MRIFVKLAPIANAPGRALGTYWHPLYEKTIYRAFASTESALSYKRETEQSLSTDSPAEEMKVRQLLILFKAERPTSTVFTYRRTILWDLLETFGDWNPRDISVSVFEAWFQRNCQERKYAANTIDGEKTFLNYFFRFLIDKGLIEKSPVIQTGNAKRKRILSAEEIQTVLSETKRLSPGHLYPMALIAAEAKAQRNEIFELQWKNVDLKRGIIYFDRKTHVEAHKMSEELHASLCSIRRVSLFVFVSQAGKPMDQMTLLQTRGRFRRLTTFKVAWTLDDLRQLQ